MAGNIHVLRASISPLSSPQEIATNTAATKYSYLEGRDSIVANERVSEDEKLILVGRIRQ